jgi:hypothetical protein
MKKGERMKKYLWGTVFITFAIGGYAFAQEQAPDMGVIDSILSWAKPMLEAAAGSYGVVVQIISVIGVLRLVFKPVMSVVQAVISLTPTLSDDQLLSKILGSKVYKIASYLLDWTASIKLPQKIESPKV